MGRYDQALIDGVTPMLSQLFDPARSGNTALYRISGLVLAAVGPVAFVATPAQSGGAEVSEVPAIVLSGHTADLWGAAFSPDGTRVVTGSSDKTARIWNTSSGATLLVLAGHDEAVRAAIFSPDGTEVATACRNGLVKIWNAATGVEIASMTAHAEMIEAIAFSPDSERLATASRDEPPASGTQGPAA